MKIKAICDLAQLSDIDLFNEISVGMSLIIENSTRIYTDAQKLLTQGGCRGYQILRYFASEEASKFMILLDAIRCDRKNNDYFSKQLKRFNDHLAKGIYTEYYEIKPTDFKEVREWIDDERQEYYLEGPNDIDWIFHNFILQQREERMYVDFIKSEDDNLWISPERYDILPSSKSSLKIVPKVIQLSTTLYNIGISKPKSLEIIAKKWRSIKMVNDFTWQNLRILNEATLDDLKKNKLLQNLTKVIKTNLIDSWLFPIYTLNLRMIEINKKYLKDIQDNYNPY